MDADAPYSMECAKSLNDVCMGLLDYVDVSCQNRNNCDYCSNDDN